MPCPKNAKGAEVPDLTHLPQHVQTSSEEPLRKHPRTGDRGIRIWHVRFGVLSKNLRKFQSQNSQNSQSVKILWFLVPSPSHFELLPICASRRLQPPGSGLGHWWRWRRRRHWWHLGRDDLGHQGQGRSLARERKVWSRSWLWFVCPVVYLVDILHVSCIMMHNADRCANFISCLYIYNVIGYAH